MVLKEKEKHKGHKSCEQNKNRGILIIVEEERWDANRGISKLRCLSILEIFTWGALGIPKLELLPLFVLLILIAPRSSNTSSTQNFNKNFVRSVSIIKQITTSGTVVNSFQFHISTISTVFQLHHGSYTPILPIDSSK